MNINVYAVQPESLYLYTPEYIHLNACEDKSSGILYVISLLTPMS